MGEKITRQDIRKKGLACPWCEKWLVVSVSSFQERHKCPKCQKGVLLVSRIESIEALRLTPSIEGK